MSIKMKVLAVFGVSIVLVVILAAYTITAQGNSTNDLEDLQTNVNEDMSAINDTELPLYTEAWKIKWLDEVLTSSAARYIQAEGDSYWVDRYWEKADELTAAFIATGAIPDPDTEPLASDQDLQYFVDVSFANDALVAYESQIIYLVEEGVSLAAEGNDAEAALKYKEAEDILYGETIPKEIDWYDGGPQDSVPNTIYDDTYPNYKADYWEGMIQFFAAQEGRIQDHIAETETSLSTTVQDQIDQSNSTRTIVIVLIIVIVVVNIILGLWLAMNITSRVNKLKTISDRLAKGDIEGLQVDISGNDEIGQFGESFKGVLAAFNELYNEANKKG